MGYKGKNQPDEKTAAIIDECEEQLRKAARPACIWRIFDICRKSGEIRLKGCSFSLPGKHIEKHLEGCRQVAVICSTLSGDVDRFIKKQSLADPLKGLATDALASAYVEALSDNAREEMLSHTENCTANFVFGAGYGDFPLNMTSHLLAAVDAQRKIGVTVTEAGMIIPCKTIVGVSGIKPGDSQSEPESKCSTCAMRSKCSFAEE